MAKYILKRIVMSVVILFFILAILFILLEFMPGTPFNDEKLNEDQIAVLYQKYGLDKPLYQQFFLYVKNMLKGDFGVSYENALVNKQELSVLNRYSVVL